MTYIVIGMSFCMCLPNSIVIKSDDRRPSYDVISIFRDGGQSRKSTSGFRFSDGICLRRWKSICMPNFDEISLSTAEIKLLPVSENGRPPYWNFNSGFDFDLCVVIGMPFCICLPNFVVNRRSSTEFDVMSIFSRWPPAAILDLIWVMLDHPRSTTAGLSLVLNWS